MYSYNPYYSSYLAHHGILGMHWGIRRYQPYPGQVPKGSKEVGAATKVKQRKEYESENARRAQKSAKVLKAMAIGLGVSAAAIGTTYAINKYGPRIIDGSIKAGTKVQTISDSPAYANGNRIYAAINDSDKQVYEGVYGEQIANRAGRAFKVNREAIGNIKVASDKSAEKVMNELRKKDPEFDNTVKALVKRYSAPGLSDYQKFNTALVDKSDEGRKATEKFYNALKEKGYGAVRDFNDRAYAGGGFKTKDPVIVFDMGKLKDSSVSEINILDIPTKWEEGAEILRKQYHKEYKQPQMIQKTAIGSAVLAGYGIATDAGANVIEKEYQKKKKKGATKNAV